jgi:hypothetical protein
MVTMPMPRQDAQLRQAIRSGPPAHARSSRTSGPPRSATS